MLLVVNLFVKFKQEFDLIIQITTNNKNGSVVSETTNPFTELPFYGSYGSQRKIFLISETIAKKA